MTEVNHVNKVFEEFKGFFITTVACIVMEPVQGVKKHSYVGEIYCLGSMVAVEMVNNWTNKHYRKNLFQ